MPSDINGVPVHPAAELFPLLTGRAFEELKADIQQHGLLTPITYLDGEIIDGRNRYRACMELGITPDEDEIDLDVVPDPFAWVISTNLHRRHLSETQREVIAAKIASLKVGDNQHTKEDGQNCPSSNDEAAEQLNVKPRSVKNAKSAIKGGCDELVAAMERDEITSSLASKFVKAVPDKRKQKAIVKEGVAAVRQVVKDHESDKALNAKPKQTKQKEEEVWEDVAPPEANRIGETFDRLVSELEAYECRVLGEKLIEYADAQ